MNPNKRECSDEKLTVYRAQVGLWVIKDPRRWGNRRFGSHQEAMQKAAELTSGGGKA
jgi:hypothetical protein